MGDRILAVGGPAGLGDLALDEPGEGVGLQRHVVDAEGGHDRGRPGEQEVADHDRHRVVPAVIGALGPSAQVGLVHHVVVIEAGDVGQLDDQGGPLDGIGVGVRVQLRGQHHEQRPEPLAAGVDDVRGGLGDERGVAEGGRGQPVLDASQAVGDGLRERGVDTDLESHTSPCPSGLGPA